MTSTTNPTTINAEAGVPFIDIVREFDAPVEALFRAHTDAGVYAQWTGPRDLPFRIVDFDARVGGRWQYIAFEGTEQEFGFRGVFHTVDPTLIIQTFEFSAAPGAAGISSTTFADIGDGRTRMTIREIYPSVEARDMAVASGMEYGIVEGHRRLDEMFGDAS